MGGQAKRRSWMTGRRAMSDRKRIALSVAALAAVALLLQMRLHQSGSGRARRAADERPTSARRDAAASARRPTGRVETAATTPARCRQGDGDDRWRHLAGGFLLPNHTAAPLAADYRFDPDGGRDVLVFLHIQKTGGTTFGRHLVSDLDLASPCRCRADRKKCECRSGKDEVWAVSRYSTGWKCGLHADWTELTQCVDGMLDKLEGGHRERRYLYLTILRDPYRRYLSEFKHVQRGATWKAARLRCDGRQASLEEVPFCFEGANWTGVSLEAFMRCPHNLANNRQVRMLANLSLSGCYRSGAATRAARDCTMLRSARRNLRQMAFFGLTEYQRDTQRLLERTLGLRFRADFVQYNRTHAGDDRITAAERSEILKLNSLDVELYEYARRLFFERLRALPSGGATDAEVGAAGRGRPTANSYVIVRRQDYDDDDGDVDDDVDDDEYNDRIANRKKQDGGRRDDVGGA